MLILSFWRGWMRGGGIEGGWYLWDVVMMRMMMEESRNNCNTIVKFVVRRCISSFALKI